MTIVSETRAREIHFTSAEDLLECGDMKVGSSLSGKNTELKVLRRVWRGEYLDVRQGK